MQFPRIKPFRFNIMNTYKVPAYQTGRLDLISNQFYNDTRYYKAIASANNILLSYGVRPGIRKQSDAIRNELIMKGYKGTALETEYNRLMDESRLTAFDWVAYDNGSYGYITDVYEGILLLIPDLATADLYLTQYEYLGE